jgi:hypothetical protein
MPGDVINRRILNSKIQRVDNVRLHVQDLGLLELFPSNFIIDDAEF